MQQVLLILCGLPASGKTRLARSIQRELEAQMKVVIVRTDDWRKEEYYSPFLPENEVRVRQLAKIRVKELVTNGTSVIHDDTNYYTSMRHELRSIALSQHCVFAIVYVSTTLETALQWNRQRRSNIPDEVIIRIDARLDIPGSRYTWDKPIVIVNLGSQDTGYATKKITEQLRKLNPIKDEDYILEKITIVEKYDVLTRKIVKEFLQDYPAYRGNPKITQIRREIMEKVKISNRLPDEIERELRFELEKMK